MTPWSVVTAKYKAVLIAAGAAGLFCAGATVEHWRAGKKLAEQAQKSTAEKLVRQTALSERQQKAQAEALAAVLAAHAELKATRAENAKLSRAAALAAPTAPEYACRDKALPDDYLETFRQ